jgi:TraT complement resistance protein
MMFSIKNSIVYVLAILLISGCATTKLQTNVKMTRSVFLKPVVKEKKTIFFSTKNISGEALDIEPLIAKNIAQKGYARIEDPEQAQYVLIVNILFANNLKEANALKAATGMGITGGVIAAGSGSNTGDSLLIGATMALAGGLVGKALEDETYRAVVDVSISHKLPEGERFSTETAGTMGRAYKEHKTRVLAEAVKMNLELKEALPILSHDVARQISNIF